jgi:hypothetical protein
MALLLLWTLVMIWAASAAVARADGDPASDVLASQAAFVPADAGVPAGQQSQLAALLATASRAGYQVRVAVIASSTDLGSVTALWHQPQNYARFLGQELSLVYRGTLLVVMPDGYGVYRMAGVPPSEGSALAALGAPVADLGGAALSAVQRLGAASGHPLALPAQTSSRAPARSDVLAWLVFAVGCALIAAAWTASLRARPVRPRPTPSG